MDNGAQRGNNEMCRIRWLVCGLVWMFCPWLAQARADAPAITISEPSPADGGAIGSLNPTLSVAVRHRAGKTMDIALSSDASGRWEEIARFADAPSGTFKVCPTNMLRRGETYRWTVAATDGTVSQSKTFSFNLAVFPGVRHGRHGRHYHLHESGVVPSGRSGQAGRPPRQALVVLLSRRIEHG